MDLWKATYTVYGLIAPAFDFFASSLPPPSSSWMTWRDVTSISLRSVLTSSSYIFVGLPMRHFPSNRICHPSVFRHPCEAIFSCFSFLWIEYFLNSLLDLAISTMSPPNATRWCLLLFIMRLVLIPLSFKIISCTGCG